MEHSGKGSDDEEIADDVRQLLGQTAPAQRGSDDWDSSAERASMDFEHSDGNCNSGDKRGRGGLRACGVRRGRKGRGRSKSSVRGRGRGAHFSLCMICECHDALVNCLFFSIYSDEKTFISSCFLLCVLVRYQPVMIAKNFFCVCKKLSPRSIACIFFCNENGNKTKPDSKFSFSFLQISCYIFPVSFTVYDLEISENYYL